MPDCSGVVDRVPVSEVDNMWECKVCKWAWEVESKALTCPRCLAQDVLRRMTQKDIIEAIQAGCITYCEKCQSVHTR